MRKYEPIAVEQLFNSIAPSYDRLNDLLSLGLHRLWKKQLLNWLKPTSGENWLDLCCGTGDLAIALAERVLPEGSVLGLDAAIEPLLLAKERAAKSSWLEISWLQGDALNTGLPAESFDGIVMAYGLRNLADPSIALLEIRRLLKRGARAGVLDFNHLEEGSIPDKFQKFYLRQIVVPVAQNFGLHDQYSYLEESIKAFPEGKLQVQMAYQAGFSEASHQLLAGRQMGALLLKA